MSKPMKGTKLADLAWGHMMGFMDIFVSEPSRSIQNADKETLTEFLKRWRPFVEAVERADIPKWILVREKQGGHVPPAEPVHSEEPPQAAAAEPVQSDAPPVEELVP